MKKKVCFQIRSNISPVPYYYYLDTNKTSWNYDHDYSIVEPWEGQYFPPPEVRSFETYSFTSTFVPKFSQRNISCARRNTQVLSEQLITIDTAFLSPNSANENEFLLNFLKTPFLPPDLFLMMDAKVLYETISTSVNFSNFVENSFRPTPIKPEQVLIPGQKVLIGSILKNADRPRHTINFTKSCEHFISKSNESQIPNIIQKLIDNQLLLPEIIIFLIFETNSKIYTPQVRNAWRLLLILISTINFHQIMDAANEANTPKPDEKFDIILILKSYLALVASEQKVSNKNITKYAILCLLRLSCKGTPVLEYNENHVSNYIQMCESNKRLFGFCLGEIIAKENLFLLGHNTKIRHSRVHLDIHSQSNNLSLTSMASTFSVSSFNISTSSNYFIHNAFNTTTVGPLLNGEEQAKEISLVPKVLKTIVKLIIDMGGLKTENIFRHKPIDEDECNKIISELNQGRTEVTANDVHSVACVLKTFFQTLQEPLIPLSAAYSFSTSMRFYECIYKAETLSNENKETLKYMIGFLQELISFKEITKMGVNDLTRIFASFFIRNVTNQPQVPMDSLISNTAWFLTCLIDHWDTEDIYDKHSNDFVYNTTIV